MKAAILTLALLALQGCIAVIGGLPGAIKDSNRKSDLQRYSACVGQYEGPGAERDKCVEILQ